MERFIISLAWKLFGERSWWPEPGTAMVPPGPRPKVEDVWGRRPRGPQELQERREELADLAHRQWSGWMRYLFSKGRDTADGTWTMPAWAVERWGRQMRTSYLDLSEEEKESDRSEADKFLEVFRDG